MPAGRRAAHVPERSQQTPVLQQGTLTTRIQIQVGIHTRHPGLLERPDQRHRAASMDW